MAHDSPRLVAEDPLTVAVGIEQCSFHPGRGACHDERQEGVVAGDPRRSPLSVLPAAGSLRVGAAHEGRS